MGVDITQRNASRNQSTADFQRNNVFLYGNRYTETTFRNNSGATMTAKAGILVIRHTDAAEVVPAVSGSTLANVVGFLNVVGENEMTDGATMTANLCLSGDIDSSLITLPTGVTLDTIVSGKALKDILTALGFVLHNVVEGSNLDN